MNTAEKWHGTTIVLLRKNGETVVAGDGQVSLGNTVLKSKAKKVSGLVNDKPNSSGTIEPSKIPTTVVNCHTIHRVNPAPSK